ncbi:hypothetical protein ABIE65_002289 [Constrictibacter sp. MBR-5]|jgi:hypothetical protein|uniref:terminase small subunit n=1 Tax=Constrictibacter sp. MBR-5 TaxID=3156467 RepID=UPI0033998B00
MPEASPPPLTDRQEIFCRHVARGASGAAAARWAGYAPDSAAKQASVMLGRPHIRRRVEDLRVRREIARQTGIAEMVDRLRALAKLATAKCDYRTAVRCIEIEAKATGLIPDKHAASPCGGFAGSDPLLDGIDPRWPGHAAAEAEGWLAEWRRGLAPEPEEKPEPIIVPHVYEGFEGRPLDEFTPYTDLERMRANQQKGMEGKEREPSIDEVEAEDPDPIASREARAEAALEAELAYLRSIAPPVAINPAAPSWARHPDPLVRGGQSDLHGWDPAWERPG